MTQKYIKHFSSLFNIDLNVFDLNLKEFSDFNKTFCSRCPYKCDYKNTHLYGVYESIRWDSKYIYYCPKDFIFIAVPLLDEYDIHSSGVIAGPILMGDISDYQDTYGLPNIETSKINDLTEILSAVFSTKPSLDANTSTADFLNTIYKELEVLPKNQKYPIELEKQLQLAIKNADREKARELLNRLLGEIFFRSNAKFSVIKARVLELLVLLSRSVIESGADISEIFSLNNTYISELERFDSLEKLSVWLTNVINRFVSYVFDFSDIKHSNTVHKIIEYINSNYMNKIALEDIAEYVYMSKSYVSKIFNEEMNISLSAFINKVRIDKSKHLLLDPSISIADVANLIGFDDQSYFTKQFKSVTGISPKKYREKHGL